MPTAASIQNFSKNYLNVMYNSTITLKGINMFRFAQATVFFMAVVCLVAGSAYSLESSAKNAKTSDGIEYVYINLSSDMQSYQVAPKDDGKWKDVTSDDTAEKHAKINADMSSYQVMSKSGADSSLPYYQSIREKILTKLKRNYANHYNDGDVNLFFILNKEGAIVRIDVALSRSTKDTKLIDTALLSLQQAAPFGPLPKDLNAQQVLFSLIISFKKDNR
ncbi:MAG: hypothetical protein NTZ95_04640 [Candidatus Omnitrophica bacterium]|nr:hypothetical protein [Candidatus Omnitrophota bacterium]